MARKKGANLATYGRQREDMTPSEMSAACKRQEALGVSERAMTDMATKSTIKATAAKYGLSRTFVSRIVDDVSAIDARLRGVKPAKPAKPGDAVESAA